MENIKFYVVTFLLVVGAGFLGYGAISSLRDPVYYVNNQTLTTVGELKTGTSIEPTTSDTTTPVADTAIPEVPTTEPVTPDPVATTTTSTSKNADLIARLQKIPSGTILKIGSKGDDVKAVQQALNILAAAKLTVNSSFDEKTVAAVRKYQTSVKLPSTGQVSDKTLAVMVSKLK
jgi:peptidoglycan hydrolase-like protein with peptidoglycan-binding domain